MYEAFVVREFVELGALCLAVGNQCLFVVVVVVVCIVKFEKNVEEEEKESTKKNTMMNMRISFNENPIKNRSIYTLVDAARKLSRMPILCLFHSLYRSLLCQLCMIKVYTFTAAETNQRRAGYMYAALYCTRITSSTTTKKDPPKR